MKTDRSAEVRFSVPGMALSGLQWGESTESLPTLALHGWLDNAASFVPLAPFLLQRPLLALDMPGHGLSEHRAPPGAYNIWDDLLDILALADQLGWSEFNLIGHSRGAFVSLLLAATMPERVHRLVLLDGVWPVPVKASKGAATLRRYLEDQRAFAQKKLPQYATMADAVSNWQKASGVPREAAELLVARGITEHPDGGVTWRSDPRLRLGSAFKLTAGHNRAFLGAVRVPSLVLLASRGYGALQGVQKMLRRHPQFQLELLEADHHLHMGPDTARVAALINNFLAAEH